MNKKNSIVIVLLLLIIAILGNKYMDSQSQKRALQKSIDMEFKGQLSRALRSFGKVVNDYTSHEATDRLMQIANETFFFPENKGNDK